jgi:hypothetical protein
MVARDRQFHAFFVARLCIVRCKTIRTPDSENIAGLWRFFAVLRWFTQETLQDGKIIAQFGRLLAGRL